MIFPLGHENMKGRRWPVISLVIIAINLFAFLGTKSHLDDDVSPQAVAKEHILFLTARFPTMGLESAMTPEVQSMVDAYKHDHPDDYRIMGDNRSRPTDQWETGLLMRLEWDPVELKEEMRQLCKEYEDAATTQQGSFFGQYAFVPSHPTLVSYITSMFLHAGWAHLIFNLWFLWLAGSVLEDAWGRIAYPIFYLAAGIVGSFAYLISAPHSDIPAIGASGAIAGLMGGFLTRFPKVRIRLAWLVPVGFRFRAIKFLAPAYVVLPLWFVGEIINGIIGHDNVGHWTHAAGFAFGIGGALLLKASGIEHALNQQIEEKVSWTADPELVRANELMEKNQFDEAISEAQNLLKRKSNSIDAYEIILKVQEKRGDYTAQQETLGTLCRLYGAAGNGKMAWECYGLYQNLGGKNMPAAALLEICKHLEREQSWDAALTQYRQVIEQYLQDRASITAMIACGRICLKLNRIPEAEKYYRAAAASPVPHLDMEGMISAGLRQCAAAASAAAGQGTT